MSFDSLLDHQLIIERATAGAVDDYNQPTSTYATLATVAGGVHPKKAEEVAQANQAGAVVSTHTTYLRPTDITEADRIRHVRATCPMPEPGDLADLTLQLDGIRNPAGRGHHYEIDCHVVTA